MDKKINMTLVSREGCVHCAETKEILKKIQPEYPELAVEEIDMTTPQGQEFISKYGIMSSPGVIINGELFSMGGTTEKELRKKFAELK
ncbi:MAG: thioredoxin family protein [Candidatus Sungbacteria bacterium]|uniref:Thioredoxin family protein n=1 Tax=Candidatus Sungiibacteriota bacterium TaxID=2750080 RepID=A0A931WPF1_9BACT|nr:thioredoxin family protein [Candidatus Sungbacteria bacterium]